MIKIYTSNSCPFCNKAKKFLKLKGFEYDEINVEDNREAKEELFEKSKQLSLPVLDISGVIVVGFDKQSIEKALGGV